MGCAEGSGSGPVYPPDLYRGGHPIRQFILKNYGVGGGSLISAHLGWGGGGHCTDLVEVIIYLIRLIRNEQGCVQCWCGLYWGNEIHGCSSAVLGCRCVGMEHGGTTIISIMELGECSWSDCYISQYYRSHCYRSHYYRSHCQSDSLNSKAWTDAGFWACLWKIAGFWACLWTIAATEHVYEHLLQTFDTCDGVQGGTEQWSATEAWWQ